MFHNTTTVEDVWICMSFERPRRLRSRGVCQRWLPSGSSGSRRPSRFFRPAPQLDQLIKAEACPITSATLPKYLVKLQQKCFLILNSLHLRIFEIFSSDYSSKRQFVDEDVQHFLSPLVNPLANLVAYAEKITTVLKINY